MNKFSHISINIHTVESGGGDTPVHGCFLLGLFTLTIFGLACGLQGEKEPLATIESKVQATVSKDVNLNRRVYLGDFNGDGKTDILRADWNGSGTENNVVLIAEPDGTWLPEMGPQAWLGGDKRAVHIGDFNGDGRDDILRADWNGEEKEWNALFLSQADGSWTRELGPAEILGGENWRSYVGDFNKDGKSGLLRVSTLGRQGNMVLHFQRDGTWSKWTEDLTLALGGDGIELHIADFNGDGLSDILRASSAGDGRRHNGVLLSNGDGTWKPVIGSPGLLLLGKYRSVHIGDFDGDGTADILRAQWDHGGKKWNATAFSNGDGTFRIERKGPTVRLGGQDRRVYIGDFNGDGRDDVLRADYHGDEFFYNTVVLSLGDGSFERLEGYPKIKLGQQLESRKILQQVKYRCGRGGTCSFTQTLYGPSAIWVGIGDFNGDGRDDILRAAWNGNGIEYNRIQMGTPDATFDFHTSIALPLGGATRIGEFCQAPCLYVVPQPKQTVRTSDFKLISAIQNPTTKVGPKSQPPTDANISVEYGFLTPTPWIEEDSQSSPIKNRRQTFTPDLNGDGRDDLLFYSKGWYGAISTGEGLTAPKLWLSANGGPTGATYHEGHQFLADMNGDGRADLMYENRGWHVALSRGDRFEAPVLWLGNKAVLNGGSTINREESFLADLNGDGRTDYLFRNTDWYVALSSGTGFHPPRMWLGGRHSPTGKAHNARSQYVVDLNGDRRADLMFHDRGWYVALSRGDRFHYPRLWLSDNEASGGKTNPERAHFVSDFTGDGLNDLLFRDGDWFVARSNGMEFLAPTLWLKGEFPAIGATHNPDLQHVADVSGDGRSDYLFYSDGWYVSRSNGRAFEKPSLWFRKDETSGKASPDPRQTFWGDFDGDGSVDLSFYDGGLQVAVSSSDSEPPAPFMKLPPLVLHEITFVDDSKTTVLTVPDLAIAVILESVYLKTIQDLNFIPHTGVVIDVSFAPASPCDFTDVALFLQQPSRMEELFRAGIRAEETAWMNAVVEAQKYLLQMRTSYSALTNKELQELEETKHIERVGPYLPGSGLLVGEFWIAMGRGNILLRKRLISYR